MHTISLCMIVKNEEASLARCLASAAGVADEIVIVDTGSTDRTKEIAAQFTNRVFDFPWTDDFSAARNDAFGKARMEYQMWLDADDVLLPADAAQLQALKETLPPEVDAVMMRYNTNFDEQGRPTFSFYRERMVKRSRGFRWQEPVHEYLAVGGTIIFSDICVTHAKQKPPESDRNLRIYEKCLREGRTLSPRGEYYYARELKDHGRLPEAAQMFRRFLDGGRGWREDNINACGELARCL